MLDVNDFIADRGGNPEKIKCVLPTILTPVPLSSGKVCG